MYTIPEDDDPRKKPTQPGSGSGFQRRIPELRRGAMGRRMKSKINQSKMGTPHQQHMAHLEHMKNVKNNPRKYK